MLGSIMFYIKVVTSASGKINLKDLMLWIYYILHRLIWKNYLSSFNNILYNQNNVTYLENLVWTTRLKFTRLHVHNCSQNNPQKLF